jgi:hypothetical protein
MRSIADTMERELTDERLARLEREIELIKQRNSRVEADKAWELSWVRAAAICLMTYAIAASFLYLVGTERFWLHALTPVFGFYLSVRSMPIIKKWWISSHYQRGKVNPSLPSYSTESLDKKSDTVPTD